MWRSSGVAGKIERFHRALRTEFRTDLGLCIHGHGWVELDEWVSDYTTNRHQAAAAWRPPAGRPMCGSPIKSFSSTPAIGSCALGNAQAPQRRPRVRVSVTDWPK